MQQADHSPAGSYYFSLFTIIICHSFYRGSKYQLYSSLRQCVRHAINCWNPILIASFVAPHKYTSHRHCVRHPINYWNPMLTNFHSLRVMDILLGKLRLTQQRNITLLPSAIDVQRSSLALECLQDVTELQTQYCTQVPSTSDCCTVLQHCIGNIFRTWPDYRSSTACVFLHDRQRSSVAFFFSPQDTFNVQNDPLLHGSNFRMWWIYRSSIA